MIDSLPNTKQKLTPAFSLSLIQFYTKILLKKIENKSSDDEKKKAINNIQWDDIDFDALNAHEEITILNESFLLCDVVLFILVEKIKTQSTHFKIPWINHLLSSNFLKDVNWLDEIMNYYVILHAF